MPGAGKPSASSAIPAFWKGKAGRWVEVETVPIEFLFLLHADSELSAGDVRED